MLNRKVQTAKAQSSNPFARGPQSFGGSAEGLNSADQASIQQTVSDLSNDNARLTKENQDLREQIQGALNSISDNVETHRQKIEDGTAKIRELEVKFKAGGLVPSAGGAGGSNAGLIAPPRVSGAMPTLSASQGDNVLDVLRELDSSLNKVAERLQGGVSDLQKIESLSSKRQPPIVLAPVPRPPVQAAPPPRTQTVRQMPPNLPSPPHASNAVGTIIWVCLSRCQGRTLDMFDAFSKIVKARSGNLPLRHEFIQAHGKSQLMAEIQKQPNVKGAIYLGINQVDDADSDAFAMLAAVRLQVQPVFFLQSEQPPAPKPDSGILYAHFWANDFPASPHNEETYNKVSNGLRLLA
ncbi:hypothetical protein HDU97_003693 [Phlyctochytrium planicorne]|nr:hypothetical protein HDU97_003693 [Phlyctochytrium planicorne]